MQPVQVGTILLESQPLMTQFLELESEPFAGNWSVVKALDGFALDHKIRKAGWSFFFMAADVTATFFGGLAAEKVRNALRCILGKVAQDHFNALEVTAIVTKRFLGIPYTVVMAHSRHVQPGFTLDSVNTRRKRQHDAEWQEIER